jgi:peptidoglycan-associated lipoprotein
MGRQVVKMRNLIIFLCLIVFVLIYTGCAEKQITKSEGTVYTQNESSAKQNVQSNAVGKSVKQNEQTSAGKKSAKQNNSKEQTTRAQTAVRTTDDLVDVHFDFDRYDIRQEDRKILSSLAGYLLKSKNVKIVIEGNCDERGTAEYNLALGNRRAEEAKKFLVNSGVDRKRIETISYGMERPLDPAHNENAWAKNRRDHFVVK